MLQVNKQQLSQIFNMKLQPSCLMSSDWSSWFEEVQPVECFTGVFSKGYNYTSDICDFTSITAEFASVPLNRNELGLSYELLFCKEPDTQTGSRSPDLRARECVSDVCCSHGAEAGSHFVN